MRYGLFAHRYWSALTGQRTPGVGQEQAKDSFQRRYWASFTMTDLPVRWPIPDRPHLVRAGVLPSANAWDLLDSRPLREEADRVSHERFRVLAPLAAALAVVAVAVGLHVGLASSSRVSEAMLLAPRAALAIPSGTAADFGTALNDIAFSPVGWTIAIGRSSGRVEVWNVGKESPIFSSKSRIRPSTYLAFSSNGKVLAAGYASGRIELWNAATLTVLGTVQGSKPEHAVAFSPDGRTLATADSGGRVWLWNITDPAHPRLPRTIRVGGTVRAVAFSPDGRTLAAANCLGQVSLWNITDPAHPQRLWSGTIGRLGSLANSVAFSPDGRTLAAGDSDGTIARWSVITGHPLGARLTTGGSAVHGIAFSAGGRALAAGDAAGGIDLWDETGQLTAAYPGSGSSVSSVAFRPDAATLMAGTTGHLLLFDYSPSLAGPGTMPSSFAPLCELRSASAEATVRSM